MNDRVLTRKQTAAMLGISDTTLWRMEGRGEMPPRVYITSRCIGYRASAIDALITSWEDPGKIKVAIEGNSKKSSEG